MGKRQIFSVVSLVFTYGQWYIIGREDFTLINL